MICGSLKGPAIAGRDTVGSDAALQGNAR